MWPCANPFPRMPCCHEPPKDSFFLFPAASTSSPEPGVLSSVPFLRATLWWPRQRERTLHNSLVTNTVVSHVRPLGLYKTKLCGGWSRVRSGPYAKKHSRYTREGVNAPSTFWQTIPVPSQSTTSLNNSKPEGRCGWGSLCSPGTQTQLRSLRCRNPLEAPETSLFRNHRTCLWTLCAGCQRENTSKRRRSFNLFIQSSFSQCINTAY